MDALNQPGPVSKGKILRLKQGYNPNSSSIGTMIFAMPVAMLSTAVAFGTVSGLIFSAFSKMTATEKTEEKETLDGSNG